MQEKKEKSDKKIAIRVIKQQLTLKGLSERGIKSLKSTIAILKGING